MKSENSIYSNRAEQLQFLRFIAFILIFLWHIDSWTYSWFPHENGACLAVSFFFMLNGLVSAYSSYNNNIECSIKCVVKDMWKKIKKFYPLYFIVTIYTICYTNIPDAFINGDFSFKMIEVKDLLRNLFLVQSWDTGNYFSFSGVGWFLSTLMFLNLIKLPILRMAQRIRDDKNSVLYFAIIILVSGLSMVAYCFQIRDLVMQYWSYIFPGARIGEYIIGICVANIVRLVSDKVNCAKLKNNKKWFTLLEIIAFVCWLGFMYIPMQFWGFRLAHWLFPNTFLLCVFAFGNGYISKLFKCKIAIWLGNITFECFLIHQIIIYEFAYHTGIEPANLSGKVFCTMFCLILTILISSILHKKSK